MRKHERPEKWILITMLLACAVSGLTAVVSPAETNNVVLSVRGELDQPLALTLADLQAMPRVEARAKEKDGTEAAFEGVSLAEILKRSKLRLTEKCCGNAANTCVIVRAADNYRVVFSLAEIAPEFTDRVVVLADSREGKSLPASVGPLRLVVPGEKVHARWVRQVTALEIVRVASESKP
jgi:DMSO/TMAO reductase YedYZ molybdopterin-dependent catalytic subunit